jgi:hypothetical protein
MVHAGYVAGFCEACSLFRFADLGLGKSGFTDPEAAELLPDEWMMQRVPFT